MFVKGLIKRIIKTLIACIIAFALVSGGCMLYYNLPVHYSNSSGATDYKWETGKFYSRGTEGFALGKTNNDGFNNKSDYNGQQIDILFMGSSHGEAFNVSQNKNCVSLLNDKLDGSMFVYNIATSGHTICNIVSDLNDAINTYHPQKYVIIECQSLSPKRENLVAAVDGTLPRLESESGGIIELLQKNPYLRLLYRQLSSLSNVDEEDTSKSTLPESPDFEYIQAVNDFVLKIKNDCKVGNVTPIIVYHPHFNIDENGEIKTTTNENYSGLFETVCEENNVEYVNMLSDFINGYRKDNKLPYGFSNTAVGEGHLNEYGHSLVANRLYKIIEDMEATK